MTNEQFSKYLESTGTELVIDEAQEWGPGVLEQAAEAWALRFCQYEGCVRAFTHLTLACDSHWYMLPTKLRGEIRGEWESHGPSERYSQLTAIVLRAWDDHGTALQHGR